ncbi:uncharacterized protein LOC143301209 [Babylonia areolata]|uniref:uncharacterized protein LOC143301209 n=1 Tax=Babylonia areolata TaxID=304850 RepID=UPI003FD166E2
MKLLVVCTGTVLLLQLALSVAFSDAEWGEEGGVSKRSYPRARRGWSMMRLGRGLQMLRLGKRQPPPSPTITPRATPEEMREVLDMLLDGDALGPARTPPRPERHGEEDAVEELLRLLEDMSREPPVPTGRFKRSTRTFSTMRGQSSGSDQSKPAFSAHAPASRQHQGHVAEKSNRPSPRERHQEVRDGHVTVSNVTGSDEMKSERSLK